MEQSPGLTPKTGTYLVMAGGGLLSISVFLPWVHVILLGDLSLMQLADMSHQHTGALLIVIAGLASASIAFAQPERIHLRFWISIIAALLGIFYGYEIIHSVNADGFIKIQNGAYLAILAGVLLIVGVVSDLKR